MGVPEPAGDGHHSSEGLEAIAGDRLEATPPQAASQVARKRGNRTHAYHSVLAHSKERRHEQVREGDSSNNLAGAEGRPTCGWGTDGASMTRRANAWGVRRGCR